MQLSVILRDLYPTASPVMDYQVTLTPDGERVTGWHLPGPQPTPAELEAAWAGAAARLELRATLTEYQGLLDERYRLFTRAMANGNAAAQLEIQEEIQLILSALQEVRDALSAA